eukprot:4093863-Pleurochrysis_carterae.AAC.1
MAGGASRAVSTSGGRGSPARGTTRPSPPPLRLPVPAAHAPRKYRAPPRLRRPPLPHGTSFAAAATPSGLSASN